MMLFSLAACGDNDTPSGSEGGNNPSSSQTDDKNGGESTDNGSDENSDINVELFDIADSNIIPIKN